MSSRSWEYGLTPIRKVLPQRGIRRIGDAPGFEVQTWLSTEEISALDYAAYWNDESREAAKDAFYVLDGDFTKMERHLEAHNLVRQLRECAWKLSSLGHPLHGTGADLASGSLWTIPTLLQSGTVDKVYCVEYSKHRLLKLGPLLLQHYGVPSDKVVLCLGNFYDLKLDNSSLEFVLLAQAFHHADHPQRLLQEIRRVLRPAGTVIILGEHVPDFVPNPVRRVVRAVVLSVLRRVMPSTVQKVLFGRTLERVAPPPDLELGDHYYLEDDYRRMFSESHFGFWKLEHRGAPLQSYVLVKPEDDR